MYFMIFRLFKIGILIFFDYKYNLWGIVEELEEYNELIKFCYKRAVERLFEGCLVNGGFYVKFG